MKTSDYKTEAGTRSNSAAGMSSAKQPLALTAGNFVSEVSFCSHGNTD